MDFGGISLQQLSKLVLRCWSYVERYHHSPITSKGLQFQRKGLHHSGVSTLSLSDQDQAEGHSKFAGSLWARHIVWQLRLAGDGSTAIANNTTGYNHATFSQLVPPCTASNDGPVAISVFTGSTSCLSNLVLDSFPIGGDGVRFLNLNLLRFAVLNLTLSCIFPGMPLAGHAIFWMRRRAFST